MSTVLKWKVKTLDVRNIPVEMLEQRFTDLTVRLRTIDAKKKLYSALSNVFYVHLIESSEKVTRGGSAWQPSL